MKNLFSFIFILLSVGAYSQGFMSSKNIKIDFSGFVRNDFIFDSHRNVDACDHLLELYPVKAVLDANGKDINAKAHTQFLDIFTRFGTRFTGLEMGKAKVSGYVEVDFTGSTSTNSLRLRHAYSLFAWEKTKLLFGRTWHPTFIEKVYPSTLNENTGAPFQVFNRTPQLRLTHQLSKNLDLIAAAVYQYNYANNGPAGKTYQYQLDAIVPNLHLQLQYYDASWVLGAALDWKSIQPRTFTTANGKDYKTSQKLNTMAAIAYLKYSKGKFEFKAKSMYGQNVCESLLPGGYAVATVNSSTGAETYTPTNHVYSWVNFIYGDSWKFGLFVGHLKNLGTKVNPVNMGTMEKPIYKFYASAPDMDICYRISPQLIHTYKNFMFGWEMSLTTASYGDIDYSNKGKIKNAESVSNFRNMISVVYLF